MVQQVRDVMTPSPTAVPPETSCAEAAQIMRDEDIGAVLVDDGRLRGLVTDRDLVVRGLAEGEDCVTTAIGSLCSTDPVTVDADAGAAAAADLMRQHALRRLPVVDGGRTVGVVSLGDLAVERDPDSALGGISAADPTA